MSSLNIFRYLFKSASLVDLLDTDIHVMELIRVKAMLNYSRVQFLFDS